MRRAIAMGAMLIALTAAAANAGPPFGCCVCTSSIEMQVLNCAAVPSPDIPDFDLSCSLQGGVAACSAALEPDACQALFAEAGCFGAAPAPVAGGPALLAIAALLGAGGMLALRRKRGSAETGWTRRPAADLRLGVAEHCAMPARARCPSYLRLRGWNPLHAPGVIGSE